MHSSMMAETPLMSALPHYSSASRRKFGILSLTPRTPNVRRFGPLGSSWRPTGGLSRLAASRRTSTPLPQSVRGQANTSISQVLQRTEQEENNIKALMSKTWQVYRVTPLYNVTTQKKSDLQQYSRTLSSHIAAETKKGSFVDISEPGDAVVGTFSGLDTGIDDPKALLVQVKGKARNKLKESVVCEAVLFSTDLECNPLKPEDQPHFTYYSTLLLRGPVTLAETVQNWIEVQFDCKVVKQTFASHELAFMAAMFTGFDEDHKPLDLVYSVPDEVEGLSDISYSTDHADCKRLWIQVRSVDSQDQNTFTVEEAQLFIAGLESHFFEIFHIKLNAMPLDTIDGPVAFVARTGKLKIHAKSTESVLHVLRHLTDISLDQLKVT